MYPVERDDWITFGLWEKDASGEKIPVGYCDVSVVSDRVAMMSLISPRRPKNFSGLEEVLKNEEGFLSAFAIKDEYRCQNLGQLLLAITLATLEKRGFQTIDIVGDVTAERIRYEQPDPKAPPSYCFRPNNSIRGREFISEDAGL